VGWNSLCHISQFLSVVAAMPDTGTVIKATPGLHSAPETVAVRLISPWRKCPASDEQQEWWVPCPPLGSVFFLSLS